MSSATKAVATLVVKLWCRELATLFKTSEKRIKVFAILAFAVAVFYGVIIAILGSSQLTQELPPDLRGTLLRTALGGAVMTTGMVSTVMCISVPPRSSVSALLELLPVTRWKCRIGQLVPVLVVGLVFSLALSSICLSVGWRILPFDLSLVSFIATYLFIVLCVESIAVSSFACVCDILRNRARVPQQYSQVIAGALTISLVVLSAAPDIFIVRETSVSSLDPRVLLIHRAGARVLEDSIFSPSGLILFAWAGLAIVGLLSMGRGRGADITPGSIRLLVGIKPGSGVCKAAFWYETLVAVRTPQAIVTALSLAPIVACVWWMQAIPFLHDTAVALARGVPLIPFLLSVYAVGGSMRQRWIGVLITGSKSWWVIPSVVSSGFVSLCLSSPVVIAELNFELITYHDLLSLAARGFLALASALVAGALVPYSDEQPLSATVSGFVGALVYIGSGLAIQVATSWQKYVSAEAFTTVLAVALLLAFFAILGRYNSEELRRA